MVRMLAMALGPLAVPSGPWPVAHTPSPRGRGPTFLTHQDVLPRSSHQHPDLMGSMIITAGKYFIHVFVRRSIGLICTYHFKLFFLMYSLHFVIQSRNKWYAVRDGSQLVFGKMSWPTYGLWRAGPIMGYS